MHFIHTRGTPKPKTSGESVMKQTFPVWCKTNVLSSSLLSMWMYFIWEPLLLLIIIITINLQIRPHAERIWEPGCIRTLCHCDGVSIWKGTSQVVYPKRPTCLFYLSFMMVVEYSTLRYTLWCVLSLVFCSVNNQFCRCWQNTWRRVSGMAGCGPWEMRSVPTLV